MSNIVVHIPAGFGHCAAVYVGGPGARRNEPIYSTYLPLDVPELDGCRVQRAVGKYLARSDKRPLIVAGEGTAKEDAQWLETVNRALVWRFPLDELLTGRALDVLCRRCTPPANVFGPDVADGIALVAVKVLGDLTKCEALEAHIADKKAAFR